MDWTIYSGDELIYDRDIVADNGVRPYEVIDPVMVETTGGFSNLTFKAVDGSPAVQEMKTIYPLVKVYDGTNLYWTGRCLSDTPDIHGEHEYYVEDFLGVLNDSICHPYDFFGTVTEFLEMLIDRHNSQVEEWQQFSSVSCDVESQFETGNISRSSVTYAKTWSVVQEKLLKMLGGYMWVSYDANEKPVLNYSSSARDTATQTIEIGENLARISIKTDATKFYTACIPLGKQDDETKEYLTIRSVNDDVDYLVNELAVVEHGMIFAPIEDTTWPDVTLPENLLARGQEWIQNQSAQNVQEISLDAVDSGEGEPFFWLDGVRTIAPSRGLDAVFIITSLTRNLKKPRSVSVTLNYSGKKITGTLASATASNTRVIEAIRADYTTAGQVAAIAQSQIERSTWIEQTAQAIALGAVEDFKKSDSEEDGGYAWFRSYVASQLSILADQIILDFETLSNSISTGDGEINSTLEDYRAWFRFLASGAMVIGNSGSEVQMVLKNDVLYFCTDPDTVTESTAIAYFAAGQLYVNFANMNNLTIGPTGKWLDVRIVGTGANTCALFSGRLS